MSQRTRREAPSAIFLWTITTVLIFVVLLLVIARRYHQANPIPRLSPRGITALYSLPSTPLSS